MRKRLLIGMALAISLTGVIIGCSSGESQEEKSVTAGYIQVPDGPKIKVVCVDFPWELEVVWEQLGMEGFQLMLKGTLVNTSNQLVSFDRITFVLDGQRIGYWPSLGTCCLRPNEGSDFGWGGVGYSGTSKVLEVKIVGFQNISASAQEVRTIQIPDGPTIDFAYIGPLELEIKWDELDLWWGISGTIKNVSNQRARFSRITFILDGQEIRHWPSIGDCLLEPGEEKEFESGRLGYSRSSKLFEVKIEGFEVLSGSNVTKAEQTTPASTLEVANFDLPELMELRKATEEVITSARLVASDEERRLLGEAEEVLGVIAPDSKLHDIVAEKSEERWVILDILSGIFSVGAQAFYRIPSPVAWAITEGAEELGNKIAEWQVLGQLGLATVADNDRGNLGIVYYKERGEAWLNFDIYNPAGRICMYISVEPVLVSPEGGGNVLLSKGVRPVMEKCVVAYRLGEVSLPKNPGEVLRTFIALLCERRFSETWDYCTPDLQNSVGSRDGMASGWESFFNNEIYLLGYEYLEGITDLQEAIDNGRYEIVIDKEVIKDDRASVEATITWYMPDGTEGGNQGLSMGLALVEGRWKITIEEAVPIIDESEAGQKELTNIQTAVTFMMVDNRLTELPNPVTSPTNDMSVFPDTSVCGIDKLSDWQGNAYVKGQDKDGYVLYDHDVTADGRQTGLLKYVATQYTIGSYTVDMYGTVTQVTTGYE